MKLPRYKEIWVVDFEFHCSDGSRPRPICMVAKELLSGRVIRLDEEALNHLLAAPFDTGPDSLFVAYFASAEFGCFLALGWPLPMNVVDLYVEFRNLTNGLKPAHGEGLLGALLYFGLPPGNGLEKDEMRALAMRGSPFTADEMVALVDYCGHDVEALEMLWQTMEPRLDRSALLRGKYMESVARMERTGIPIDTETLARLTDRWEDLKVNLIGKIDPRGDLWRDGRFSEQRFSQWLQLRNIPWPYLPTGRLRLDQDTWSDVAKCQPLVRPIADLRATLAKLRLTDLAVGKDGRNRTMLSAFRSKTGRNQPSTSRFIFGNAAWLRSLVQPKPGMALAYLDWCQQEFGIGAVLSGDAAMKEAYVSSDPYLAFAKQAGAAPSDATKDSHPGVRSAYKMAALGVGYCMTAVGLSSKLGITLAAAEDLLQIHRRCFPDFWKWTQGATDCGQLNGRIQTRFGWTLNVTAITKPRTLANFPCQGNGAELMRLAAVYAMNAGIRVCAPVHDAFLIESPDDLIEQDVSQMRICMARASADVLDGFALRADSEIFRYPSRFGGGQSTMWKLAMEHMSNPCPAGKLPPYLMGSPD